MDKHALLASITHQLTLLARAIQQPDSDAIAPGDLVQIAPDADDVYSRYFLHVASVTADLARDLIDAAQRNNIPLPILLIWIHDRPRPLRFAPPDFLRWAERYRLTNITPARQTHPQPAANSPGDTADPPEDPGDHR